MSDKTSQKYWFKRKRYGYGWIPSTWQGWLVTLGPGLVLIALSLYLFDDFDEDASATKMFVFLGLVSLSVLFIVGVASVKGPKPKWRGSKKPDDNPGGDW